MNDDPMNATADDRLVPREASELTYHERVLAGAADEEQPLLERVRFCSFFTSLTDEFFRVRLVSLHEKAAAGDPEAEQLLNEMFGRFGELSRYQHQLWVEQLRPALHEQGIELYSWADLDDAGRKHATERFDTEIFPLLTPLAVGPAHPFPFISDLSLSLGVRFHSDDGGPEFVRVKIPASLQRFMRVDSGDGPTQLIRVEEVIGANLAALFPGRRIIDHHMFRVTRNADYEVDSDEVIDLRQTIESEIYDRQFGDAIRLEVTHGMPDEVVDFLMRELALTRAAVFTTPGPLDLGEIGELYDLDRPDLKRPRMKSVDVASLAGDDIFVQLRERDHLVQHPYESFASSTQRFIEQAASDPRVLAIKQTLYRTSGDSPIVRAMIDAAQQGKQAVMLVELKARFDEEANLRWAEQLGAAGVHVVYGFVEMKTHTKVALVVRRDEDGQVRRYGHIGTGNYNPSTARFYEDLALFTTDEEITNDVVRLFNMLTGHSKGLEPDRLLIAPTTLRPRLVELIRSQAHEGGRIVLKANHLAHEAIIDALYEAGQAGASIDLIMRTTCRLRAGVPGLSENIRVRSVVAPFLEHSRIFKFGDDPEPGGYLIGSADLMTRNLDKRVEAVVPVDQTEHRARLDQVLDELLADEALSWVLNPDDTWTKVEGDRNAQDRLAKAARKRNKR